MTMLRPVSEMKDSEIQEIGIIPKEWNCARIARIIENSAEGIMVGPFGSSLTGSVVGEAEGKYKVYGQANLIRRDFDYGDKFVDESKYNELIRYKVIPGDIAISMMGTVGKCRVIPDGIRDGIMDSHLIKARLSGYMLPKYFEYIYESSAVFEQIMAKSTGTIMTGLNSGIVKSLYVVLPPIAEQQAIVAYLDDLCSKLDELITEAEKSIEEYKELKQAVISETVKKGLSDCEERVSDIPWIGSYNSNYRITRLGRFCFVTKLAGFEYTNIMADAISYDAEIPIVRAQNVKMFRFNNASIREYIAENVSLKLSRCALDKKALLITFIGAGIGDVCIFDEPIRYHLAPNVAKIEINDEYKNLITEKYLMYYLGSSAGQGEIKKISKASAQPSLSMETIRSISILIPSINEQNQISDYLDVKCLKIDSLILEKEQLICELNEYKKSLIYEVVTGKKRVIV